ncbi:hypothetical protein NDU88_000394, partial [Pleurodeles waltl]
HCLKTLWPQRFTKGCWESAENVGMASVRVYTCYKVIYRPGNLGCIGTRLNQLQWKLGARPSGMHVNTLAPSLEFKNGGKGAILTWISYDFSCIYQNTSTDTMI